MVQMNLCESLDRRRGDERIGGEVCFLLDNFWEVSGAKRGTHIETSGRQHRKNYTLNLWRGWLRRRGLRRRYRRCRWLWCSLSRRSLSGLAGIGRLSGRRYIILVAAAARSSNHKNKTKDNNPEKLLLTDLSPHNVPSPLWTISWLNRP